MVMFLQAKRQVTKKLRGMILGWHVGMLGEERGDLHLCNKSSHCFTPNYTLIPLLESNLHKFQPRSINNAWWAAHCYCKRRILPVQWTSYRLYKRALPANRLKCKFTVFFGGLFVVNCCPFAEKLWTLWYEKVATNNSPWTDKATSSKRPFFLGFARNI